VLNYNGLVVADKKVEAAQAQIETVCQRRLDLIPNLIETVRGCAAYEQQTLSVIVAARGNAQDVLKRVGGKKEFSADDMRELAGSQAQLQDSVRAVFALAENYPDLKAGAQFTALQDQLEGAENRISVERQRYNEAVRTYNTKIDTFPGNVIAPWFGFERGSYFEAPAVAMNAVAVKF
ncbi:MAG: LemA family protein, partial [Candidatus Omnitrophica bacterium]|nr:LemA family protein [Candidatus Omnitrophota bacterium]